MGKTVGAIIGIVAAVAIAIAAPYLAPLALGVLGITATATAVAIATAVIAIGLSLAVSFAFKALGIGSVPKAKETIGPPQVFRQSITSSFIIYGKRRVGGLLVFFHARVSGSDHFRYFVVACAGHRCKQVDSWMLNDETVTVDGSGKVTSGKYANAAWLFFQRGLASETANATFVSECGGNWTSNHKGSGVAAIYAKFQMTDAVVQAGMPNITAVIEGRDEILDYRDGSIGYSRNAALIFYDWLLIAREEGGFGAYDDEVPLASWISAQANVCDETVNSNPRYAFDAVLTTGAAPSEVRDAMVVNCAGTYTFSGGKHLMRPGYWVPVTAMVEEKDLAGPIQVTPFFPTDVTANELQGTYISPADGYQGMPFTTQSLPGADVRQLDLDLAFTTNKDQADRVARIMLKRAACEKQVVWPMNIAGLGVRALDTVQCDTSRYSLSNYAFSVSGWGMSSDWGVVLNLREENAEIYDDPAPVSPSSPPAIVQPSGPLDPSQVTGITDPAQSLVFKYDYLGAAQTGEFSRDLTFKLLNNTGAQITSGITWTYLVLNGTVNTFTNASGAQSMSGSGTGTLTASSLGSSTATVQVTATFNGLAYLKVITLSRSVAAAPVTTSGGAGSSGTIASKSSGFSGPSSTTFVDSSGALIGNPANTAVSINVALDAQPISGTNSSWTVECKVMRDIAGTPTLVGSVQSAGSDWHGVDANNPASFAFTISDTVPAAGTAYTWRVYMRLTSGARTHNVTGSVTVTT